MIGLIETCSVWKNNNKDCVRRNASCNLCNGIVVHIPVQGLNVQVKICDTRICGPFMCLAYFLHRMKEKGKFVGVRVPRDSFEPELHYKYFSRLLK
jgi:hypothetical protein